MIKTKTFFFDMMKHCLFFFWLQIYVESLQEINSAILMILIELIAESMSLEKVNGIDHIFDFPPPSFIIYLFMRLSMVVPYFMEERV